MPPNKKIKITPEYVIDEMRLFRKMFGSTKWTLEQLDRAFEALFMVVSLMEKGSKYDLAVSFWEANATEWIMRRPYIEIRQLAKGKEIKTLTQNGLCKNHEE